MIHHGDLFDVLPTLAAESIDAVVTDPPYGLEFMGKDWDAPWKGSGIGGHSESGFKVVVMADGATRLPRPNYMGGTNPRCRNCGGDQRGSEKRKRKCRCDAPDFPNVLLPRMQAFQAWCESWGREVFRVLKPGGYIVSCGAPRAYHRMTSGLEDAGFEIRDCLAWLFGSGFPKSLNIGGGLGTALKPAHEPIVLARKPFKGTVRNNVVTHGTGALNIDACRIATDDNLNGGAYNDTREFGTNQVYGRFRRMSPQDFSPPLGRWPANVVLDDIASMVLDEQSGELASGGTETDTARINGAVPLGLSERRITPRFDSGGASRFYYVAKPSREERDMGCYDLPARSGGDATDRTEGSAGLENPRAGAGRTGGARNIHPTVKPVELMRWLVKLITPPGGTVLDPFTGSGTTGMACVYEQRQFIGIEREAEYIAIAERRIAAVAPLFSETA